MSNAEKASVTLRLPSTLSTYSGGKSQITFRADTVEELLVLLQQQQPLVWERLCTPQGLLRPHVKMFVNNQLVNGPDSLRIPLKAGQEVIVLTATFTI